jgi:hypothetical protein
MERTTQKAKPVSRGNDEIESVSSSEEHGPSPLASEDDGEGGKTPPRPEVDVPAIEPDIHATKAGLNPAKPGTSAAASEDDGEGGKTPPRPEAKPEFGTADNSSASPDTNSAGIQTVPGADTAGSKPTSDTSGDITAKDPQHGTSDAASKPESRTADNTSYNASSRKGILSLSQTMLRNSKVLTPLQDPSDDLHDAAASSLLPLDLSMKTVDRDCHCLFKALMVCMDTTELSHWDVRKHIVD